MNRAQAAHEAVLRDPREAVRLASLVTADPTAPIDERASAAWATGRAHTELDQIDKARSVLREGVGLAAEEGHITLAAQIRVSLAASLLCAGDTDGARDELDLADPHLATNGSRAMLESQRAVVEMVSGNLDVAVERFDETDRLLSASIGGPSEDGLEADAIANARLRMLVNRGIILAMTGDLDRAEVDLVEGRMLADGMNQAMLAAGAAQNLAYVHHCRGDVPTALEWFGRARDGYEAVGSPRRIMFPMESDLLHDGLLGAACRTQRIDNFALAADRSGVLR